MERILERSSLFCVGEATGKGTMGVSDFTSWCSPVCLGCPRSVGLPHGYLNLGMKHKAQHLAATLSLFVLSFFFFFFRPEAAMCCNCLLWLLERLSNFLSSFLLSFSLPRFIMERGG